MLFCSRTNCFLKFNLFLLFSDQGVKLIVLNTPRCYLQLHSVASSPSYICTTPSCTNLPSHMSHRARRLQWTWIWISVTDSLETFHRKILPKPTFKSLPRVTHSKEKYNEDESTSPKFNCHIIFFYPLRSLSCSLCCDSFLLVLAVARWALFLNLNTLFHGSVAHCMVFIESAYSLKIQMLVCP
jgi:hypothetical protein